MSEYYSTEASLNARVSALRLKGFIDFDGDNSPDEASLTSAYKMARGIIRGKLAGHYTETVIDAWTDTAVPELLGTISDDLCLYQILLSNPKFAQAFQVIYENSLKQLDAIASGQLELYGVDRNTSNITNYLDTGSIDSDFDPERELDDMTVRTTWILPDNRDLENY